MPEEEIKAFDDIISPLVEMVSPYTPFLIITQKSLNVKNYL